MKVRASHEVESSTPVAARRLVVVEGILEATSKKRTMSKDHRVRLLCQNTKTSALVAAIVAGLTVGRISTSAWRATVATLHLVATAVSTSIARNTPAVVRHLAVSLRSHARSPLSSVVPVATTCRARSSHRRLLVRIARHRTSRVRSTLRRHGLRTAVLRKAIGR